MRSILLMEGALDHSLIRRAPRGTHFDFVAGLVNDIGKAAGNVIEGKDPFAGIGGIAGGIGNIINAAGGSKPSGSSPTGAAAAVPVTTASGSFDAAPVILVLALVGVIAFVGKD